MKQLSNEASPKHKMLVESLKPGDVIETDIWFDGVYWHIGKEGAPAERVKFKRGYLCVVRYVHGLFYVTSTYFSVKGIQPVLHDVVRWVEEVQKFMSVAYQRPVYWFPESSDKVVATRPVIVERYNLEPWNVSDDLNDAVMGNNDFFELHKPKVLH